MSQRADRVWRAAVLHAANRNEDYFKLSPPGTIEVLEGGRTRSVQSPNGRNRWLVADPAQKERVLKIDTELASAKPVPPQQMFSGKQQINQDKQ